jgi:beta-glucanase (GH16 family)
MTSLAVLATVCAQDVEAAGDVASPARAAADAETKAKVKREPCGGMSPRKASGRRYTCTFSDDFDGTVLDRTKWMVQDTRVTGVASGNKDCYLDSPNNISVSGGAVHLTARVEPRVFFCHRGIFSFFTNTSGATIVTKGHFAQAYGRFEFRAALPAYSGPGLHSAMWLYPAENTYGPWPTSGEVDVAEWFSALADHVYPTLHYRGEPPRGDTGEDCAVADPWNYHRYALEWTPTAMRFSYDGQECFAASWTPAPPLSAPQPFDQPFYVVLTQIFGVLFNHATPATPKVATMDVDWVRVWK